MTRCWQSADQERAVVDVAGAPLRHGDAANAAGRIFKGEGRTPISSTPANLRPEHEWRVSGARGQSGCPYARETQVELYLDQPATKTVRARCCGPLSAPPPDSNGVGDRPQARMCGEASSPADRNKVVHADEMKFARLSAGGRRIRTIGPSRVKSICLDTVLPPGAVEKACSERHSTLGGTGSSNPSCSRGRLEHRRFQGSDHP